MNAVQLMEKNNLQKFKEVLKKSAYDETCSVTFHYFEIFRRQGHWKILLTGMVLQFTVGN